MLAMMIKMMVARIDAFHPTQIYIGVNILMQFYRA